jgi:hypothetical protein
MPFGLGFFATAGVSAAGSFDLLETQVLGSSTASVTFSSLSTYASAGYQHLQIRGVWKGDSSTGLGAGLLRFNGDSGTNYSSHLLDGTGSSVTSAAVVNNSYIFPGYFTRNNSNSTRFGGFVCDILDPFETTKYKTTRTLWGVNDSSNYVGLASGSWRNTEALTSITLSGDTGNILTGSRFSLYGIKAA